MDPKWAAEVVAPNRDLRWWLQNRGVRSSLKKKQKEFLLRHQKWVRVPDLRLNSTSYRSLRFLLVYVLEISVSELLVLGINVHMSQKFNVHLQKASSLLDTKMAPLPVIKPKMFYKGKPVSSRRGNALAQRATKEKQMVELDETPPKRITKGASKKH